MHMGTDWIISQNKAITLHAAFAVWQPDGVRSILVAKLAIVAIWIYSTVIAIVSYMLRVDQPDEYMPVRINIPLPRIFTSISLRSTNAGTQHHLLCWSCTGSSTGTGSLLQGASCPVSRSIFAVGEPSIWTKTTGGRSKSSAKINRTQMRLDSAPSNCSCEFL